MSFQDTIVKALMEGYATSDLTITTMFLCIGFTALIAFYVFVVYKLLNRNSFFNRSFALSLLGLSVITSAIILTIQSNIVVSLGMVGALSIVRFRTAIKDPMDLVFLFWSISVGIICGAGFAMIAVIASAILTIIIIVVSLLPSEKNTQVLVINAKSYDSDAVMKTVKEHTSFARIRARNISRANTNYAVEVRCRKEQELLKSLMEMENVTNVSLVEHDGDITA